MSKADSKVQPSKAVNTTKKATSPVQQENKPEKTPDMQLAAIDQPPRYKPAITALLAEAEKHRHQGDLDLAVAVTERALRIDGRNPHITYRLAQYRLEQKKSRLAENLAKKAALLAGPDRGLKKQCWYLIRAARLQQQDISGAQEALNQAEQI